MSIVRTYTTGKSGLRIDGRDALKQLIKDVESGSAEFSVILVYDVSRWGRSKLARMLNERGIRTDLERAWTLRLLERSVSPNVGKPASGSRG
jgi:hypothetical protein